MSSGVSSFPHSHCEYSLGVGCITNKHRRIYPRRCTPLLCGCRRCPSIPSYSSELLLRRGYKSPPSRRALRCSFSTCPNPDLSLGCYVVPPYTVVKIYQDQIPDKLPNNISEMITPLEVIPMRHTWPADPSPPRYYCVDDLITHKLGAWRVQTGPYDSEPHKQPL